MSVSSTKLHKGSKHICLEKNFKMRELDRLIPEIQTSQKKFALNKPRSSESIFEKFLIDVVEEGLSSLGDSCKDTIYFYLRRRFQIGKQEIPHEIEAFTSALEEIFGAGARLIELRIIEALYQRVNRFKYFPKQRDITFTEYVTAMRNFLGCR